MPDWMAARDSMFWLWLDRVSIILSFFVVFSIAAFFFNLLRYRRKRSELADITGKTARPQALAIALGGGSIKSAVESYLKESYPNVTIPVEEHKDGEITGANIHRHEDAIRRIKEKYQSDNVTELHIFMKGPVALALAVGAIFDNWVTVKLYHSKREGGYEPWTTLHQAKASSIGDELAERVAQIVDVKPQGSPIRRTPRTSQVEK